MASVDHSGCQGTTTASAATQGIWKRSRSGSTYWTPTTKSGCTSRIRHNNRSRSSHPYGVGIFALLFHNHEPTLDNVVKL